jgi:hypothetical protein
LLSFPSTGASLPSRQLGTRRSDVAPYRQHQATSLVRVVRPSVPLPLVRPPSFAQLRRRRFPGFSSRQRYQRDLLERSRRPAALLAGTSRGRLSKRAESDAGELDRWTYAQHRGGRSGRELQLCVPCGGGRSATRSACRGEDQDWADKAAQPAGEDVRPPFRLSSFLLLHTDRSSRLADLSSACSLSLRSPTCISFPPPHLRSKLAFASSFLPAFSPSAAPVRCSSPSPLLACSARSLDDDHASRASARRHSEQNAEPPTHLDLRHRHHLDRLPRDLFP